jgi:hypothetical protein
MKNFAISIVAIVTMSVAAVTTVSAQNVQSVEKNGQVCYSIKISESNVAECAKYLNAHPADTIRNLFEAPVLEMTASQDTSVIRNQGETTIALKAGDKLFRAGLQVVWGPERLPMGYYYEVLGKNQLPPRVVADSAEVAKIDSMAAATQVLLNVASNFGKYPMIVYYYDCDLHSLTDGKIVKAAHRPLGWSLVGEVGGRVSFNNSDLNGLVAMAGMRYTTRVFNARKLQAMAQATVGIVRLLEPANAENANEGYYTPSFNMVAGLGLPLDELRSSGLYLVGGIALDYERTLTKKNDKGLLQSRNLNLHPKLGAMLVLEPDRHPNGITISVMYEPVSQTIQNQGSIVNHCVVATVSAQLGVLRHWVKTTLK